MFNIIVPSAEAVNKFKASGVKKQSKTSLSWLSKVSSIENSSSFEALLRYEKPAVSGFQQPIKKNPDSLVHS